MDYTALGRRIRIQRRTLHLTQEQVAERSGISLSFLGHIERGTRKASLETLISISNVLKVSPAVLLQDSLLYPNTDVNPSQKQRELINEISRVILEKFDE